MSTLSTARHREKYGRLSGRTKDRFVKMPLVLLRKDFHLMCRLA